MRFILPLLLLSILPACAILDPNEGEVSAASVGAALFVSNRTDARIYYFVVGRGTAAWINWAPHLFPEHSVGRSSTARIDHADIFRFDEEPEVLVYWWHAVGKGARRKPGEIHSVLVKL